MNYFCSLFILILILIFAMHFSKSRKRRFILLPSIFLALWAYKYWLHYICERGFGEWERNWCYFYRMKRSQSSSRRKKKRSYGKHFPVSWFLLRSQNSILRHCYSYLFEYVCMCVFVCVCASCRCSIQPANSDRGQFTADEICVRIFMESRHKKPKLSPNDMWICAVFVPVCVCHSRYSFSRRCATYSRR